MSVFLQVVGLVAGVMGIWQFGEAHVPTKAQPDALDDHMKYITTVRVTAGLDDINDMTNAGGEIDYILYFNNNNE